MGKPYVVADTNIKIGKQEWTQNLDIVVTDCVKPCHKENGLLYNQKQIYEVFEEFVKDLPDDCGWRIPTEVDFENLFMELGMTNSVERVLAEDGFNLKRAGYGTSEGYLKVEGKEAVIWCLGVNYLGKECQKTFSIGEFEVQGEIKEAEYWDPNQTFFASLRLVRDV